MTTARLRGTIFQRRFGLVVRLRPADRTQNLMEKKQNISVCIVFYLPVYFCLSRRDVVIHFIQSHEHKEAETRRITAARVLVSTTIYHCTAFPTDASESVPRHASEVVTA